MSEKTLGQYQSLIIISPKTIMDNSKNGRDYYNYGIQ